MAIRLCRIIVDEQNNLFATDESIVPQRLYPSGISEASPDIEGKIKKASSDSSEGNLYYIPNSEMKKFERYEQRQRFLHSVKNFFDFRKYSLR